MYLLCFSLVRSGDFSNSANPRMPFMGVRISWLILAKKADLSLSLSSALVLAITSESISSFFSVTSSFIAIKCEISPSGLKSGVIMAYSQ